MISGTWPFRINSLLPPPPSPPPPWHVLGLTAGESLRLIFPRAREKRNGCELLPNGFARTTAGPGCLCSLLARFLRFPADIRRCNQQCVRWRFWQELDRQTAWPLSFHCAGDKSLEFVSLRIRTEAAVWEALSLTSTIRYGLACALYGEETEKAEAEEEGEDERVRPGRVEALL